MAKSALACKDIGRNRKRFCFSESEMDVARQLIQLSEESDDRHDDDDNNNDNCAQGKVLGQRKGTGDAADVSSTNNTNIGDTFEKEEDGILWRRNRRFRSVYHLYRSTKPVTVVNAKRRKFAVGLISDS